MSVPAPPSRAARGPALTRTVRGLSDRGVVWLFITPTILVLLAINIFPLLWTIWLSFTNYRANRPNAEVKWVGLRNYERILNKEDIWEYLQATAHFLSWTMILQVVIGFGLALLINRQFRGHSFWTTVILLPMMLSRRWWASSGPTCSSHRPGSSATSSTSSSTSGRST